ncbi:hypothetical protein HPB47_022038 [Ixodes persulcatus]|uniref:Uncharacterized protein n=1 Tax=Ixodes persulcatus TaxID=34615 RepID=A0AC60QAU1_IXOPE|nr:hypothetical protein HPB47_022038 [Ixodes persulcatus]
MLKSVHDQYENIEALEAVLDERGSLLMEGISKIDMKLLIAFLQPFKDARNAMEREAVPKLPLFVLHLYKLKRHLNASCHRDDELTQIKERAAEYLEEKFKAHDIHMVSTSLWPQFRQLRVLSGSDRYEVLENIGQRLKSDSVCVLALLVRRYYVLPLQLLLLLLLALSRVAITNGHATELEVDARDAAYVMSTRSSWSSNARERVPRRELSRLLVIFDEMLREPLPQLAPPPLLEGNRCKRNPLVAAAAGSGSAPAAADFVRHSNPLPRRIRVTDVNNTFLG